jgi:SAM-dependent methyltransferase
MDKTAQRASEGTDCVICAGAGSRLWSRAGAYDLYRCERCRVVFAHPMPSQADLLRLYAASSYFAGGGAEGYMAGYDLSARTQSLLYEMILDQLGPPALGATLLEVGCAEGHFLAAARRRNWEVCGVELSPIAAASARRRFGLQVFEGTLDDHALEPKACSVIVLLDVIEHLRDPALTVRTAARMLRPGGRLVIKTPDIGSAHARRLGVQWPQIKPPEHLVYFDFSSITWMLHTCGFEVDKRQAVGGTGVLAALRRCTRVHPMLDRRMTVRALVASKRWRWLAWLVARTSALLGRRDSMVVFAHKVLRSTDTSIAVGGR